MRRRAVAAARQGGERSSTVRPGGGRGSWAGWRVPRPAPAAPRAALLPPPTSPTLPLCLTVIAKNRGSRAASTLRRSAPSSRARRGAAGGAAAFGAGCSALGGRGADAVAPIVAGGRWGGRGEWRAAVAEESAGRAGVERRRHSARRRPRAARAPVRSPAVDRATVARPTPPMRAAAAAPAAGRAAARRQAGVPRSAAGARRAHKASTPRAAAGPTPDPANPLAGVDPAVLEAAMADPAVQAQMAEMQAVMRNEAVQARFAALRADPDLAPMFAAIQEGGMPALMQFMNDPEWLAKVGGKMGDVSELLAAQQASAPTPPPPAATQINSLLDAAKAGDLEAVEDYIAIGRDVNEADQGGRTPLHFAAGVGACDVARELLAAGASLTAVDSEGNMPLHYAAGYGRGALVEMLVAAGAPGAAENARGQSPVELVTSEPRNPLHGNADIVRVLENAAMAGGGGDE